MGVGTGMGLAVSYRIISDHRGELSAINGDVGAHFCIKLPIAKGGDL